MSSKKRKNIPAEGEPTKDKNTSKSNNKKSKKGLIKIQSCQSFSPIRDIKDGIIITKDKKYIKIMEVSPINFLLRSVSEQNGIIRCFAAVLKQMPVKAQFKVVSRRSDVSGHLEKIYSDMEKEDNENCLKLQQEQIELISGVGAKEGVSRRFFIIFRYEEPEGFQKLPPFQEIKASLDYTAMRIQNLLSQCENEIIPLEEDSDILKVLYYIICKAESEKQAFEVRLYETISRYLGDESYDPNKDSYIPINDFIMPKMIDTKESPKYIVIDGVYYSFAYIPSKAYSTTCFGGWLSLLVNLGEGIDVDLFMRKENPATVRTKLQYALRFNKVKARSMEDTSTDYDDVRNAIDSGYYLKQGMTNGEDFCYMSIMLTVTARSVKELEWKVNEVKQFLVSQDLRLKPCLFQQEEALLMYLPLCEINESIFKKSRRNILTGSLASTYPFVSFEVNDDNGVLFGINKSNNSLVFVDNFDSKKYKNANMAILGTSGAGKTYTLECLALRMRENKTQVFIIAPEKGHEFKRACEGIGGQYIKIAPGSNQNINIMEIRQKDTEITELIDGEDSTKGSILAQKITQLHTFFSLLIPDISYEEVQLLDEALINTYKRFGITNDNDSLISEENPDEYKKMPILSDLHKELEKGGEETRHLYNILARYVTGSANSFNGQTNVNLDNKYIVLDVSSLTKEMQSVGMFIVLDYVWDKVKEDRTAKKAIFLDELWTLIGAKSSVQAAEFVLDIFKTIRAYGGSAVAATQDLNDFFALDDGKYGKGIINNSKIKLIMQLESFEAENVQGTLRLSPSEVQLITHFNRGEGLLVANSNHVQIEFRASQTEDELVTTDPKQLRLIAERKKAEREGIM